jgi:hypothetical protein
MLIVSEIETIIRNLQELQRIHQLNFELIEYFGIWLDWIRKNSIPVPDKEKFYSLVSKTRTLMNELYSASPEKTLIYKKIADEKKHLNGTDEEVPESTSAFTLQALSSSIASSCFYIFYISMQSQRF